MSAYAGGPELKSIFKARRVSSMSIRCLRNLFRISFLLFICAPQVLLMAQQVTGTMLGTVTDVSSAAIAGAKVTVTDVGTAQAHSAVTNSAGQYRFDGLPIGTYRIEISAEGFGGFAETNVELLVNQERRIDAVLKVGSVAQSVEISAAALQVETTNTQLGVVITDKTMLNLPLNGRSFIDLLSTQAGVAPGTSSTNTAGGGETSRLVSGLQSAGNYSVNGQREASNAFLVNGADTSESSYEGTLLIPNLDSIAEFRLITNSFDAEFGRFSGSVMNAITKSGTNGFHGDVFEFLRNTDLDSRGYFDRSVPVLDRNQFGFAVGGPAIKDKLFWFTDYQGTRQHQGLSSSLLTLPTSSQRAGMFTPGSLTGNVVGTSWASVLSKELGKTVAAGESYNSIFPDGVIPQAAISPIATKILSTYVPLPNSGTQYVSPQPVGITDDDKIGERVDFINRKTGNWFAYYHHDSASILTPGTFSPGFGDLNTNTLAGAQAVVITNVLPIGPKMINEARITFTRGTYFSGVPTYKPVSLSDLGFVTGVNTLGIVAPNGPPGWGTYQPAIALNNFSVAGASERKLTDNTWHASETFSRLTGSHTLKFGGEFSYFQVNQRSIPGNGSFTFNGSETGVDVADLILGAPSQYIQSGQQGLDARSRYGAAFAQDSWRAKPNLTVNAGLRWEASMPWYDTQNRIQAIIPGEQSVEYPTAPRGLLFPGDPGVVRTLAPTRYNNFGPRLGIAWSSKGSDGFLGRLMGGPGKTSIRAATGIYYTAIQEQSVVEEAGDAPYGQYWVSSAPPTFAEPFLTRADGVSQGQRFPFIYPQPGSAAAKNYDFSIFEPITSSPGYKTNNKLSYAEHFNLSIQRQLDESTVLTVAYVGTEGHRLIGHYEANPGDVGLCLSLRGSGVLPGTPECGPNQENVTFTRPNGSQVLGTRPLGQAFSWNQYVADVANSNYNSLQVTVQRRSKSLALLGAYTYSKSIDDASSYNSSMNFSNFALSRAISAFDVAHNFVASYNYNLPFASISREPGWLVNGWSLNGITRVTTGFPVPIFMTGDLSLVGTGSSYGGNNGVDRPNYVGGLHVTRDVRNTPSHSLFNSSSFTPEALGTMGNSAPAFFHGPGQFQTDLGLQKSIDVREGMSFLIRGEFFNLFNHAQFQNPNGNFSSSTFNQVTSVLPGRIGQVSAKFIW
jgi:hypothetical protein